MYSAATQWSPAIVQAGAASTLTLHSQGGVAVVKVRVHATGRVTEAKPTAPVEFVAGKSEMTTVPRAADRTAP